MSARLKPFRMILAVSLVAAAGCQPPPEPTGFAPMIEQGDPFADLQAPDVVPPELEPASAGPMISIQARFVTASADRIARVGGLRDGAVKVLSQDELSRLGLAPASAFGKAADPDTEIVSAPRLRVRSGQTARMTVGTELAYVADLAYRRDEQAPAASLEPTTRKLQAGLSLHVLPVVEGSDVVFAELEPVTLELLGVRECSAEVRLDGESRTINWHEPVLLAGRPATSRPAGVRIRPGQVIGLALRYSVHQATANARAYALGGKVTERFRPAGIRNGRSPLKRQALVIVRAEIVSEDG